MVFRPELRDLGGGQSLERMKAPEDVPQLSGGDLGQPFPEARAGRNRSQRVGEVGSAQKARKIDVADDPSPARGTVALRPSLVEIRPRDERHRGERFERALAKPHQQNVVSTGEKTS